MLLLILLLVVTSARFVLRGVMHVLCIEFLVSDCLACMTADVIKRASRSVVRQVWGERGGVGIAPDKGPADLC